MSADRGGPTDGRPTWLAALGEEDVAFVRRFLLCSGSLKDLATEYGVSYPTVRSRLDRLIAKVRAVEEVRSADALEQKLRVLVADGQMPAGLARELIATHREILQERSKG
jgi:hypothetical protein